MTRMSVMPARTASSTTYWIEGLSTTGSISFGELFDAGRNRVPSPAAGMTALRTRCITTSMPCAGAWYAATAERSSGRSGVARVARAERVLFPPHQAADVRGVADEHGRRQRRYRDHFSYVVATQRDEHRERDRAGQRRERRLVRHLREH